MDNRGAYQTVREQSDERACNFSRMTEIAIKVEGLSKRYRIGELQPTYRTLRDKLNDSFTKPFRAARNLVRKNGNGTSVGAERHSTKGSMLVTPPSHSNGNGNGSTIWALKDVSFEIKRGEVVGVIGRNGAGKSTLLKILSRITEPTEGYADITGRLASLLEVGTGFHPELTGRENIFLNGSILGMRRAEIQSKFDEIVAFAEVEKFIDTPVKYYSSGMYVRLAFSVAAHLEPEILLVDEVLGVGDAAFRKKCLGKMDDVARHGRTVLFVSHDMTSIAMLCRQTILLREGRIARVGDTHSVIADYMAEDVVVRSFVEWPLEQAPGDDVARLLKVTSSRDGGSSSQSSFALSDPINLSMEFAVLRDGVRLNPVFEVKNHLGISIFSTSNYEETGWGACDYARGRFTASCSVPPHVLNEGKYFVHAMLIHEMRVTRAESENAVTFNVFDDGSSRGDYVGEWTGIVRPRCQWRTSQC